jgi:hypothetical protein
MRCKVAIWTYLLAYVVAGASCLSLVSAGARADTSLLNVSYDVSRELYKDINPAFIAEWKAKTGEAVTVNQSHGGSSKQALSVIAGLEADVVAMNQPTDIDILVERGGLVAGDWRKRFPHDATPYTTPTVFLVRKGNPKGIKDWDDLAKPGEDVGQWPLYLPRGLGLCARQDQKRGRRARFRQQAVCQRPRARWRRPRRHHDLHATRRGRRARDVRERGDRHQRGARHRQVRRRLSVAQH